MNQLHAIGTSGIALMCFAVAVVMMCKSRIIVVMLTCAGMIALASAMAALAVSKWPIPYKSCAVQSVRSKTNEFQYQDAQINAGYYSALARKNTAEHCIPVALQLAGVLIPIGFMGIWMRSNDKR